MRMCNLSSITGIKSTVTVILVRIKDINLDHGSESLVLGPTSPPPPGNLLEMQNLWPITDLQTPKLWGWF